VVVAVLAAAVSSGYWDLTWTSQDVTRTVSAATRTLNRAEIYPGRTCETENQSREPMMMTACYFLASLYMHGDTSAESRVKTTLNL